jgi:hypothetical protein
MATYPKIPGGRRFGASALLGAFAARFLNLASFLHRGLWLAARRKPKRNGVHPKSCIFVANGVNAVVFANYRRRSAVNEVLNETAIRGFGDSSRSSA